MIHDLTESHPFLRFSLDHAQDEALGEYGKIIGKGDINLKYILLDDLLDLMLRSTDNKGCFSSEQLIS